MLAQTAVDNQLWSQTEVGDIEANPSNHVVTF